MSESDYRAFKKISDQKKKEMTQESARAFLVRAGIFTAKGNVKKVYKDLCTTPKAALVSEADVA